MTDDLTDRIARHFASDLADRLGVAVSGGSDSLAVLVALAEWGGAEIFAVTVDHGLRPEAADEAIAVAKHCQQLGIKHDVLRWSGWDGDRNLMQSARDARYSLIAAWARERGIDDVALGHTRDDVAETLLMRLQRGAGLDGLSAMADRTKRHGVTFHRPALGLSRAELRSLLVAREIEWIEDPTNEDLRFDRAKVRKIITALDLDSEALAQTAMYLRDARDALSEIATGVAQAHVQWDAGDVLIDLEALRAQPKDIVRRILRAALAYVSGSGFGPRGPALIRAMEGVLAGEETALKGCRLLHRKGMLRVVREWQAVADERCAVGELWDGRWHLEGPDKTLVVRALGEGGLALCPDRKTTGRPSAGLIASPAVWDGDELIAAPLAGLTTGWTARLMRQETAFFDALR